MNNKIVIIFSTITGNGYKLANAAAKTVPDAYGPYNIRYVNDEVIERFDTFILTYWCDKGSADNDTLQLIEKLNGKISFCWALWVSTEKQHIMPRFWRK